MLYYPQSRILTLFLLFPVLSAADLWSSHFSQVAGWTWACGGIFGIIICIIAACSFRFSRLSRLDAEMITGTQWSDEMFKKMHKTELPEERNEQGPKTKLLGIDSSVTDIFNVAITVERLSGQKIIDVNYNDDVKALVPIPEFSLSQHRSNSSVEAKRFESPSSRHMHTEEEIALQDVDQENIDDAYQEAGMLSLRNIRTESESQANLEKLRSAIHEEEKTAIMRTPSTDIPSPTIEEKPDEEKKAEIEDAADDATPEPGLRRVRTSYLNLEEKVHEWPSLKEASKGLVEIKDSFDPLVTVNEAGFEPANFQPQGRPREASTEK